MTMFHFSAVWENWVPVIVRVIFGLIFLMSAYYKIPGSDSFAMQVAMSGNVGIPFPLVAVTLAFILEVVAGSALIVGWQTRTMALLLSGFVLLIALFFYRDWSDQATMGMFINCISFSAALAYLSVYGAQYAAVARDPLPRGMTRM